MQKFLRTLALMAFLAVPWAANAQNTLTVADGTETNQYVPVYGYYVDDFVRSQTIYPASMIMEGADAVSMTGGTISSVTFYLSTPATGSWGDATFSVKLTEVSAATLSGWQDVSTATTVYEGSLDGTQPTMTIEFTTPFTYNGGNLLLEIASLTEGSYKSAYFSGITSTGASWQGNNGSSVAAITGSARNFIPKTTFSFTGGQPILCPAVKNLSASASVGNAMLSWTFSGTTSNFEVTYKIAGTEGAGTTVNATSSPFMLTGLTPNSEYEVSVRANCGTDGYGFASSTTFSTGALGCVSGFGNVQIGEGTSTSSYLPEYCLYEYSYTQQIYTASEIGASGPILGLAIMPQTVANANRDLEFYLGHVTDATATSFVVPDDLTLVYSGTSNFVADEWNTFTFQTPFNYNGTDNLIVVCRDMSGTWQGTNNFYAHTAPAGSGASRYAYQDGTAYTLGATGGTASNVRNNIILIGTCDQYATCAAPAHLTITDMTSTSASLSWVPGYQETAWEVSYRLAGAEEWTVVAANVTATSYDITGLDGNTVYEFRVGHACGDITYAVTTTGRTLCAEYVTLPFTNDFENEPYGSPYIDAFPYCWTRLNDATGTYNYYPYVYSNASSAHSGNNSLYFNAGTSSSYADTQIAVLPAVDPTVYPMNANRLTFWARTGSGTRTIEVGTMSNPADKNSFVLDSAISLTNTYKEIMLRLDKSPANNPYVAFRLLKGTSSTTIYLDDVTLEVNPQYTLAINYLTTDPGVEMGTAVASSTNPFWGDSVLLTSTPATNMRTAAWYAGEQTSVDGLTPLAVDTNDLKILVTSDTTITVVYGYGQFEIKGITANANQARMGSVAGNSPYNNDMYDYATTATLTATANTGFQFIEWLDENGDQYSTENPISIEALQPLTLTAHFGIASYEVTAEAEHGHVEGVGTYTFGASATLTAVADDHYHFVRWADDDMTNAVRSYRVVEAKTFHPVFEPDVYTVTISGPAVATYTVKDAEGNETDQFAYTTEATVEATNIDEHYTFVAWNVITYTDRNISIYTNENNGQIQNSGQIVYGIDDEGNTYVYDWNTGEMVPTTDVEESMYGTLGNGTWTFTETVQVGTTNPYTFAVENDITLTPVYSADQMTLTIASNDADMGSVSFEEFEGTSVTVDYLTQVLVHAQSVGEYSSFTGWYNGTQFVSDAADYLVTVDQPMTLTAHFEFSEYPVSVAVDPYDAGTANASSYTPQFSDNVTFTATAAPHWVFSHWTYAGQDAWLSQNAEYSEMVFEALNLVAHFVRDNHTIVATVADETHGTTVVTDENGVEATEPFTHGTYATVAFTEDYGYSFAGWMNQNNELVSTENPFTFEVTDDTVLTATVNPLPYTVYVDVNADDEGYIRGAAYVSENDASFTYDYLTEINAQLTTVPVYGYVFDNWTNVNNEVVELPMVLTQDTNVFANFKKDQFEVKGSVAADYRMMGRVAGTETVDYLEYVTLTANENTGYNFSKWVDADGNDIDLAATYEDPTTGLVYDIYTNVNGNSIDVLANEAHELFAVYDYEYYTVSVAANDDAMGDVSINGEFVAEKVLAYSQTVTLEATPVEHYHFVDWTDGNTENPRTFILNEENAVLYTANFAIDTHTVTFTYNADQVDSISLVPTNSAIAVSATNTYDYNTELQAYIEPAHGYDFKGWSHDGENVAEAAETYTFTLVQDTNLMPLFARHQFTVTVASADAVMGAVEGNATVDYEGTTTIKATPEYGYDFVNWTNNLNADVLTDAEATVQVLDNITYTAHFTEHVYVISAEANTEEMGVVEFNAPMPAAMESTVADGTTTNSYVPVYGFYADAYLRSQVVYPAADLANMAGATINSLTYYLSSPAPDAWTGKFRVFVTEVADATISSFQDMSAATIVYDGTLDGTASTMTINFAEPYNYQGGNLLVETMLYQPGNYKSATFTGVTASGASVQGYSYSSLSAVSATQRNFIPKTTFGYIPAASGDADVAIDPATGNALVKYGKNVDIQATPNYGYHFENWTNSDDATTSTDNPVNVTATKDITYTANFAKNTYNVATAVQLNNGATGTVTITGTTEDNIDVEYLDEVTLTANVNEPYRLLRWEDQNGNSLGNANPLTFAVTTDSTITAVLDFEVYTLTANTEDIEMGGVYVDDPNNAPAPVEIFNETFESLGDWTMNSCHSSTGITTTSSFRFYYSTNPPQYLISPEFTASGDLTVTFNYKVQSASYTESFQFGYSTTDNDPSSFTWETEVFTNNTSYTQYATTAPAATKYMAIKYTANDKYVLYIDDFVVLETPAPGTVPSLETSSADVDFSTPVAVTATPAEHYHFVGWKGANGDTVTALGTDANPTITVACDSTLTALFDGNMMPMTYQVNNAVRGTVEGPATAEFNTEVEISAVPAHGYEFTAWEDDATAAATRTVTVAGTDEENTYKAIFGFQTYPFAVTVENGTVSVTNDMADINDVIFTDVESIESRYYYGSEVELTFTANEHYHFVESGSTTLVKTVSFLEAPENLNIVAVIDTHNVTLAVNDPALGTIEGAESGDYAYGTELTFTATPAEHQHFVNWSDGVEDAERTITVGDDDITLTANFFVNSYEVIAEADAEQGTAEVAGADYGTCNITVNAADSYGDGWSGNTINFVQNGVVVDSYSMANQGVTNTPVEDTYVATVNAHEALSIEWVAGGVYSYPDEIGFTIVDAEGNELYTIADATELSTGDVLATVEKTCPNNVPTVLPNTNVTFTATANPGYEFVNWTNNGEEVSTEASFSMPIVENTTLTANFNFVGFAITVASNNDVMGAAYINNDAEQTTYVAAYDEEVTLNAVPEYGYIFENWTLNGTEVSTEATATVQATAAANYIANFNFDNYDLNVSVAEGQDERGTVTGAGNYPYGTQVEIAAVANDGYLFTNWNDGVTTATRTVTVDGITEYVASFRTDAIYTVTVIAENGTVSGAGTGFVENDLVSLNAVPATGYRFVNYTDAEGTVLSDNAAYSFNITSDVTLTANFAALPYDVVLNVNDAAMGTVAGAGEYTFGTQVEISATANEGYRFVQWSDDVTTNPRTIVVTADVELTAQFEAIPATVYYIAATAVNGTVEGAGEYEEGDQVSLTATANNCYQFAGWMNGTELVSTANPYVFNATQNVTLMATFEAQSFSGEETQVACESYTWNGQTYTASGDYTATLVSDKGCDSVATLHLTINTPVNVEQTAQACTEYTWTVNNQTYTESGVYTASITDANGCNATATLTLTINDVLTETVVASSCGSYEWNGQTYDASGEYTYTTTGVNGCDSIVTLQLTVNEAVNGGDSTAVACGSFEWNNEFYTQSGDYTINLIAANGCDSTVTLHLTINQAVDVAVYDTACDTYTWSANNVDYNSTGTYLYTFEQGTVTGCDSTVTLYLVINSSVNTTIEATATGSYEWNGTTYTESGEYTFNGQTVNGCDSIVTLLLTIETQTYTVTVNVNNSAMGTVNPAGEITVAAGETFTATAEANEGFRFIGWSNGATTETVTITVESDTTLTANFEAITYTINATANDETMGYVTGSGEYSHGAVVTLEAVANNGYHFVRWSDGTTNAHYEFNAIADVTITAYFEANEPQGIEDVEGADVNIYSADSKIIVKGAENLDIYVYDVNGRVVRTQAAAAETVEFTMNTTGVYLVKVGNAPAKRVVVVR